jgi:prolyl-tRNA synthetase
MPALMVKEQLGDNYSKKLNANVLAETGKSQILTMGCYGIGVSRVVASAIEQHHDDRGIIWPLAIAPFEVVIVPVNAHKSVRVREAADEVYTQLKEAGFDVLLDDRGLRPGVAFADMELIGIPHRLILGERGLDNGMIEYKCRADGTGDEFAIADVITELKTRLTH